VKKYMRNIVFACLICAWLPITAHEGHEHAQPIIKTKTITDQIFESSPDQYPHADELWLIGSFLVSLTGLVIVVRFLRH
jgi:hypothetical protein